MELFHAFAENELPQLPVADALRLAMRLIQGALAAQVAPHPPKCRAPARGTIGGR